MNGLRVPLAERRGDVGADRAALADRVLARRRRRLAGPRRVRDRGGVADRPDVVVALDLAVAVDLDPAAVVERQAELGHDRVRLDARGPGDGARRDHLAGGELGRVGRDALDRRAEPDLDPAAAQLGARELGQALGDLRHQPVARLDEHEAHAVHAGSAGRARARRRRSPAAPRGPRRPRSPRPRRRRSAASGAPRRRRSTPRARASARAGCAASIASESVLKPTACSARPGIGSVREVEPIVTTSWS